MASLKSTRSTVLGSSRRDLADSVLLYPWQRAVFVKWRFHCALRLGKVRATRLRLKIHTKMLCSGKCFPGTQVLSFVLLFSAKS